MRDERHTSCQQSLSLCCLNSARSLRSNWRTNIFARSSVLTRYSMPSSISMQSECAAQARQADSGALAGLPLTIKSSIAIQGHRCEIGSVLNRGKVADRDAEAVARLRSNGAVFLGTTNCPEFLMAYETDNLLYGKTSNPWDLDRSAGGSSGGEAAAIAAGLSAGGLGSDSGGSVREPAHFCGICSLKPTPGRVPGRGHHPPNIGPFSMLGAIGPMGRTVADVSLLFQLLAGRTLWIRRARRSPCDQSRWRTRSRSPSDGLRTTG